MSKLGGPDIISPEPSILHTSSILHTRGAAQTDMFGRLFCTLCIVHETQRGSGISDEDRCRCEKCRKNEHYMGCWRLTGSENLRSEIFLTTLKDWRMGPKYSTLFVLSTTYIWHPLTLQRRISRMSWSS